MGWIANHRCSKQTQKRRLVRECLQFQTKWCVKLHVASIETYLASKLFCSIQLRTCSTAIVRDDCVQPQSPPFDNFRWLPIFQDLSGQKCASLKVSEPSNVIYVCTSRIFCLSITASHRTFYPIAKEGLPTLNKSSHWAALTISSKQLRHLSVAVMPPNVSEVPHPTTCHKDGRIHYPETNIPPWK